MNRILNVIMVLILLAGLVSAGYLLQERLSWETSNRRFSLVVTESDLRDFAGSSDLNEPRILSELKEAGIEGIMIDRSPLDLSVNEKKVSVYREAGMSLGLKVKNSVLGAGGTGTKIRDLIRRISPSILVLQEAKVLEEDPGFTNWIRHRGIPLGIVEFDNQVFSRKLFDRGYSKLTRYHMIDSSVEKGTLSEQVDRFVRAIKERNIGVVEFRLQGGSGLDQNLVSVEKTVRRLEEIDYRLVDPENAKGVGEPLSFPRFIYLPLVLAAFGLTFFFLSRLTGLGAGVLRWTIGLSGAAGSSIAYFTEPLLLRQVTALGYAVFGPLVIYLFLRWTLRSFSADLKRALIGLIGGTSLACLFGLLLSATLTDYGFLMKLYQFRGVKFSFLFPPFAVLFLAYREGDFRPGNLRIRLKESVLLVFFLIMFAVFLMRSGNNIFLSATELERSVRTWLEANLLARPRFKEMLVGHPALLLWIYLAPKLENKFYWVILLLLGFVGQCTVINTFAHIHSPVFISLLRTANGLFIGGIGGLVLLGFGRVVSKIVRTG